MMRFIPLWNLLGLLLVASCSRSEMELVITSRPITQAQFVGNLVYIDHAVTDQDTVRFFTDTGGGRLVYADILDRLGLQPRVYEQGSQTYAMVDLNAVFKDTGIPGLVSPSSVLPRRDSSKIAGILGSSWFDEKIWHFDYAQQYLGVLDSFNWREVPSAQHQILGFLKDSVGNHATAFPRIPIVVRGDTIQMLYDSGATAYLSQAAQDAIGEMESMAVSFIVDSIFDLWCQHVPAWPQISGGDVRADQDMIEVPEVTVAGITIGPVWFARRESANFTDWMSQWMDETVYGALGGSCFQYFSTIVLDYKAEKAFFEH